MVDTLLGGWLKVPGLGRRGRRRAPADGDGCPHAEARRRMLLSATLATATCELFDLRAAQRDLRAAVLAHERDGDGAAAARLRAEETRLQARLAVAEALRRRAAADLDAAARGRRYA
ncbi:MAG TPA: hypothetical protein VFL91_09080 [Thermomicrobiales bacterium]|nr:hypothetical protein [Thermomicrobiales bacterium]